MKKTNILLIVALSFCCQHVSAQTIFWSAPFNAGHGWTLNTSTGANSATCNWWYVSCQDDGLAAGGCGSACVTGDPSLHMGSQSMGDIGAAYDAAQTTNRRAESPDINTTAAGTNTITMRFNFIHYGEGATDRCQLLYSINGGASWAFLENPIPKSPCCGGACDGQLQGQWTARSYALPATCNNITNLRIAFNWINNASGGLDPSFGVDDISLEYTAPMPVSWLSFTGSKKDDGIHLLWSTATETNNDYFEVQRSVDGVRFANLGKVKGSGNAVHVNTYNYTDKDVRSGVYLYRLKQTDLNGDFHYSEVIAVCHDNSGNGVIRLPSTLIDEVLNVQLFLQEASGILIEVTDLTGKIIMQEHKDYPKGLSQFSYNASGWASGVYYIQLLTVGKENMLAREKFIVR